MTPNARPERSSLAFPAGELEGSGVRSPRRHVGHGPARAEPSERSESRRSEALRVNRVTQTKKAWPSAMAAAAALFLGAPRASGASDPVVATTQALIAGLDFDAARTMLTAASMADGDDPRIGLERARLAIYELDCDGAATILARNDVRRVDRDGVLGEIARGCQRVTAALVQTKDEERAVEVRWQDEDDAALAPIVIDTIVRARDALTRDLGVDWPRPTRVVVVRDLLSLAAMTGLPYESAKTTGTVAVAKWGRVTLLSPRATRHGFPWRDTIAHELTHLAVTRATRDQAPLWLQEGVAKREEVRWRDPGPFDARPPPEVVVARGAERGVSFPLDKLGPSIAMLPSADAATVAFAEVTSFVRFYVDTASPGALPRLLAELKDGKDANAALVAVTGADLKAWDARWRAHVEATAHGDQAAASGGAEHLGGRALRELRERSRLATLLLARGHGASALVELDRIEPGAGIADDPTLRWMRGRALEMAGRDAEADPLVDDLSRVASSYGPWWALRGRRELAKGDPGAAGASFWEALAADPLEAEVACGSSDPSATPLDPAVAPVCVAARARNEPAFDPD
jgi:hypothetical protein